MVVTGGMRVQKFNWDMMTQFVFPEQYGVVEEVVSVDIKPIWQQIETEDSVRLVGIYHIAAVARFNPNELPETCDGTLIEELDFEGNNGYFEYGLPLEVDLPRDKVAYDCSPQVSINDVSYFVYDGSNCTFKWDVDCQFDESVEGGLFQFEQPTPIEFSQIPLPEKPVFQEAIPVSEQTPEVPENPAYEQPESPLIEVAPSYEDFLPKEEESTFTEEIRFGGTDGIFPEETSIEEGQPPEETTEETPDLNVSEQFEAPEQLDTADESPSLKAKPSVEVGESQVIEEQESEEQVTQASQNKEKVVEAKNQYFPTDADDFYNELTESYTLLDIPNKSYRE